MPRVGCQSRGVSCGGLSRASQGKLSCPRRPMPADCAPLTPARRGSLTPRVPATRTSSPRLTTHFVLFNDLACLDRLLFLFL